jgi:hypothetical protein
MPLQNRVNPQGSIISTAARGVWLGNRGVIHNPQKQIIKPYNLKAWITCALEFRGRHREVMMPDRWTELFFLDEATAFSAGHRPCFQCRYKDHQRFKAAWLKGNPQYGFNEKTPVSEIDKILHAERIDKGGKVTYEEDPANLPDGAFILIDEQPYVIFKGLMYQWTPFGYEKGIALPTIEKVKVLTPGSIVNMFRAGCYRRSLSFWRNL